MTDLKLHLGCNKTLIKGWINIDNHKEYGCDLIHDLNIIPYPFNNDSVSEVRAYHVLEHLQTPLLNIMLELHRVCKNDAILDIRVPHFSCNTALTHLTHYRVFGSRTFDVLDKNNDSEFYTSKKFMVISKKLVYCDNKIINFVIAGLANLNIVVCERLWCRLVGGFKEIQYKIKIKK